MGAWTRPRCLGDAFLLQEVACQLTYSDFPPPHSCNNSDSATALAREFARRFPRCELSLTKNILQLVHSSSVGILEVRDFTSRHYLRSFLL